MANWDGKERRSVNSEPLDRIMSRLGDIEIQIATLSEKFDNNHKAFRSFEEETKKISYTMRETIYGNGKPGLTTDISNLKALPKILNEHVQADKWGFGIMITLLITILGWTVFHS